MRALARSLRQVRYLSQLRGGVLPLNGLGENEKIPMLCNPAACSLIKPCDKEIGRYLNQSLVLLRALSTTVANEETRDFGKAGPLLEYERRTTSGELVDGDGCQVGTLRMLQRLYQQLIEHEDSCQLDRYKASEKNGRRRWLWSRLLPQSSYSPVKGLYLYGGVGTGKTMLMDLFYDQLHHKVGGDLKDFILVQSHHRVHGDFPTHAWNIYSEQLPCNWRKKRIHFHDFMLGVHSRLQMHKGVADPLEVVAGEITDESILLCLDEFMVTDVADALILNRLFRHLFSKGIVLVSTSNRAPDQLYEGGLQRDLFLPFIETLKERCVVHEIGSSTDYRKLGSAGQGFYFVGKECSELLKQKFYELIGQEIPGPQVVEVVMGRQLQVPLGANGCAYFPFEDLCDRPLGAADYFGLFKKFHTLALEGVPKFALHNRTAAYRFVTLVDVMYENRARLLCTAEASPVELFERIVTVADAQKISPRTSSRSQKTDNIDLCVDNELGFAKDRTISRLTEMNSKEYLEQHEANLQDKASQNLDEKGEALQA